MNISIFCTFYRLFQISEQKSDCVESETNRFGVFGASTIVGGAILLVYFVIRYDFFAGDAVERLRLCFQFNNYYTGSDRMWMGNGAAVKPISIAINALMPISIFLLWFSILSPHSWQQRCMIVCTSCVRTNECSTRAVYYMLVVQFALIAHTITNQPE